MRARPGTLCVAIALAATLGASASLASRSPQEFRDPQRMSEEELALAKQRSLNPLNDFGRQLEAPPEPFPWAAVVLAGICLAVAAPFGLRAYRATSREIAGSNTFGASRRDGSG
jgi:hypothetical protein